ncbi:aminoglycoside phosphotransferase family protein [Saccharopolyspora erythraea]|uniref:phosphotransferase family protein n=1 Tax=Saccharopolyspora erythraea TaxID=1836 RepID=UPI001BA92751|nr:aminoglycoside phosphotransferase family protein [Saccharopolyspora erythraea]QUH02927.1 aminoglycoside phosphotransferase family protein [Saccharopolyspora erythraea]
MTQHDQMRPQPAAARVAADVLTAHGQDFATAIRAIGWTNATWLAGELVIRVAQRPGPADLLREARLARLLPAQVGYPDVVEHGVLHGHQWVLSRRIPAENLEDVWPRLDPQQRADALRQVWERVEHVHHLDPTEVAAHARSRSPFFPATPGEAAATLRRLGAAGLLDEHQLCGLDEAMDRFWAALPGAPASLNHGDLGLCNVLWRDGQVVSVFDFEFAVIAPIAVDLNEVLKFAFGPPADDHVDPRPVQAAATAIAHAALPRAGGVDVLLGHSIMLEAWMTENEMATAADPTTLEPYLRLAALADGNGGHLAPALTPHDQPAEPAQPGLTRTGCRSETPAPPRCGQE